MRRCVWVMAAIAVAALLAPPLGARPAAYPCAPTPQDAFGPFGRGLPPLRSKIGTGHVLTGVVLSALTCRPVPRAQVQFWQENAAGRYTRATSATVVTDRAGRFRFEGPYPPSNEGRPSHIHIRVFARGFKPLLARYEPARGARSGNVRLVLEPAEL